MSLSFEDDANCSRYADHWRWLSVEFLQIVKEGRRAVISPFASNQFDGERITATDLSDPLNWWIRFPHCSSQALDEFRGCLPRQYPKLESAQGRNGLV